MKKLFVLFLLSITVLFSNQIVSAKGEVNITVNPKLSVSKIYPDGTSTIVLLRDGTVMAWGYNKYNSLGLKIKTEEKWSGQLLHRMLPEHVEGLSNVSELARGEHNLARKNDDSIWFWGYRSDAVNFLTLRPNKILGVNNIKKIENGNARFLIQEDGKVLKLKGGIEKLIRKNEDLQLTDLYQEWPYLTEVKYIETGSAIKKDGSVWVWDANDHDNTFEIRQVKGLSNIEKIGNGNGSRYVALKEDGTVWAWGRNNLGQVGNGNTDNTGIPEKLAELTDIIDISVSTSHALALKSDGTVWAWGDNYSGQLGNGTKESSNSPIQIKSLNKIKSIYTSPLVSYAITEDGITYAWGRNDYGQLGDGTKENRYEPTKILINNNDNGDIPSSVPIQVTLNGKLLRFEQPVMLINGYTMVPLRKIVDSLEGSIEWNTKLNIVKITKKDKIIEMSMDSRSVFVNNERIDLDIAPLIKNGNVLVPLKFVSEALGAKVIWDSKNYIVSITTH